MENVRKEKYTLDDSFLPNVPIEMLVDRLVGTFYEFKEEYRQPLFNYLFNLHQKYINRMYFKNNIYAFSSIPLIHRQFVDVYIKTKEFKDPNKLPSESKDDLEALWAYVKQFVLYPHFSFDRIKRLKQDVRETVVVVDTDSNMLNLNPWVEYTFDQIIHKYPTFEGRDENELRFISINIMCYFLTNMITEILWRYTKGANIPKEYRSNINMKNEFLFTRLIMSDKKKRYISSIRLREGKEIYPEKVDIKGVDFVKSSTREETKAYFINLLEEELLYSKEVNVSRILRKLEEFENIIMDSLRSGEKNFLIPKSAKELEAYADPFSQQAIRGVLAWNFIYPDSPIELPEKVDIVKTTMDTLDDIESMKETHPEIYDKMERNIFKNPNDKISKKGAGIIALPRNVEKIPDWLLPFIDYNTIINDNLSRFYSVLTSMGNETISNTKHTYFSNILKI